MGVHLSETEGHGLAGSDREGLAIAEELMVLVVAAIATAYLGEVGDELDTRSVKPSWTSLRRACVEHPLRSVASAVPERTRKHAWFSMG